MAKVNAFIGCRLGSTRVKFKNLLLLDNKPLFSYLTDNALQANKIDVCQGDERYDPLVFSPYLRVGSPLALATSRCSCACILAYISPSSGDSMEARLHAGRASTHHLAKAAHRVGAIEKFLKNQALCAPGFQNSHITLCLAVTPRELRQWRGKGPSLYGY